MITSPHNEKLKRIRGCASGASASAAGCSWPRARTWSRPRRRPGVEPELLLVAGEDVEPELLDSVSTLGSGTRVIGVYRQRWAGPARGRAGRRSRARYLHGVGDPGNVGTIIRAAHALCDGPVVLGPDCADPYSPKAVRASMGSIFARPPARADARRARGHEAGARTRAPTPPSPSSTSSRRS